MTLRESVDAALQVEPPGERDAAVADLARTYAEAIDTGGDLTKIGPALLAALEALQMSPRARALAQRGKAHDRSPSQGRLDELRAARARKNGTASVDAATS